MGDGEEEELMVKDLVFKTFGRFWEGFLISCSGVGYLVVEVHKNRKKMEKTKTDNPVLAILTS